MPFGGEEAVRGDAIADARGHGERPLAAGFGQHDCELVAAEPRHDVGFPRAATDDGGRLDERAAAVQVIVGVVDALEAVEVEEEQRQRPAAARSRASPRGARPRARYRAL